MKNYSIVTLNKKNITDFAEERNKLLKKSKTEWVLFVDSDETISKKLQREVEDAIKRPGISGYYINRKNYFLGKYAGTDRILRLARKGSGKWERAVHETWNVKGNIGELRNPIVHDTADTVSQVVEKMNRYSTLHAEANIEEGKKSGLFKIIFYPKAKFLQSLLAGRGFVFSMLQSFHSFLGWAKQWELEN